MALILLVELGAEWLAAVTAIFRRPPRSYRGYSDLSMQGMLISTLLGYSDLARFRALLQPVTNSPVYYSAFGEE